MTAALDDRIYRRWLLAGSAVGLPLSAAGAVWLFREDFSPAVAVVASVPNTLATVPLAFAYVGLIVLWHRRSAGGWLHRRISAVGRMALTNYLSQTLLGLFVLDVVLSSRELGRLALLGVAAIIWAVQLWWSSWWLSRFRFGPAEWLWRAATYGQLPASSATV